MTLFGRGSLSFLALGLAFTIAAFPHPAAAQADPSQDAPVFTLDTREASGLDTGYILKLFKDGRATFRNYVDDDPVEHAAAISAEDVAAFARELIEQQFFTMPELDTSKMFKLKDGGTVSFGYGSGQEIIATLRWAGKQRAFRHNAYVPEDIVATELGLKQKLDIHRWLHPSEHPITSWRFVRNDVQSGLKPGVTALMVAASQTRFWDAATLRSIPGSTEDINKADSTGWTPLMVAANRCIPEPVQTLIEAGAHVNAADQNGDTALFAAASLDTMGCHYLPVKNVPDILHDLLRAGTNVNQTDHGGRTALMFAVMANNVEAVQTLLAAGADRTVRDKAGLSAADYNRKGIRERHESDPDSSGIRIARLLQTRPTRP